VPVPTTLRDQRAKGYETARPDVQVHVPLQAQRILELGCSNGALGAAIKARQNAVVVGVEISPSYAETALRRIDRVIVADVEAFASGAVPDEGPFDCLVAADVLEHLVDPWNVLSQCVRFLSPGATVIISVPNILYGPGLARLVWRRTWPRDPEGIFDGTHLRWFTRTDALAMLHAAGLTPTVVQPNYFSGGWRLRAKKLLASTPLYEYLVGQYVIVAIATS
jgi:2-polyprenyl-3-methyl-5-hydroxy-6-metoxy-1,4-benzoquinol methylase